MPTTPSFPLTPRAQRRSAAAGAAPAGTTRRDLLLAALALMTLTYVWRVQDLFPALAAASPALVFTGVAVALWFFDADPRRRVHLIFTPTLKILLAIAVFIVLSIPGSLWPGNSVRFLYQDYGLTFVFMLMIAVAIRGIRDLEWFGLINMIGAALYSAVVLGRGKVGADGRLSGLRYYDANDLALVIVCTLPLVVYFLRKEVKLWLRITAICCFALLTLTVVKTGSRGGFIGLVVAMGYILFYYGAIKKSTRIAAAAAGLVVLTVVGSESYWARVQSILRPEEDYNWSDNNLAGRKAIWTRGVGYMASRPLFGVGVRCFSQAEGMLSSVGVRRGTQGQGFKWSAAHNSFVEIGAEVGLPALALFIFAFLRSMQVLGRLRAAPAAAPGEAAFAQALIGSLLAFMVTGFFLSQAYSAYLYTLFGMIIGLSKLHPEVFTSRTARPAARPSRGVRVSRSGYPAPGPLSPGSAHP